VRTYRINFYLYIICVLYGRHAGAKGGALIDKLSPIWTYLNKYKSYKSYKDLIYQFHLDLIRDLHGRQAGAEGGALPTRRHSVDQKERGH
jgi:hypothetical protein